MTETTTKDEDGVEPDAETLDALDAEAIADLVCDDPRVGLEMARSVIALSNVIGAVFKATETHPDDLLGISLQGLLLAHGITRSRVVTEEDLADARFSGFTKGELVMEEMPAFTAARDAVADVMALTAEEGETE